jgi:hypothetical protein
MSKLIKLLLMFEVNSRCASNFTLVAIAHVFHEEENQLEAIKCSEYALLSGEENFYVPYLYMRDTLDLNINLNFLFLTTETCTVSVDVKLHSCVYFVFMLGSLI